jgi:predicted transcriptional regulator
MTVMKKVVIGILPQEQIRKRMLAIAKGEYKPARSEPKVWFTSMKSLAEVLSDQNRALLKLIAENEPASLAELAELSGRQSSNLSRTLKTLSTYGFVELKKDRKRVIPVAKATTFEIQAA